MKTYLYTTRRALHAQFWANAAVQLGPRPTHRRGRDGDYSTDTRLAWCGWIDSLANAGYISEALAQRATL